MSEFSVRRPVTILMMSLGLVVLGLISADRIQLRLLPPISTPEFSIVTEYKGATPKEVEKTVTTPIEKAISTEAGLYRVESYSESGRSDIRLKFSSDIDILETISNIRDKIEGVGLDETISRPKILRFNPNAMPVLRASFTSDPKSGLSAFQLAEFIQDNLLKKIETIDGVALATLMGVPKKEIFVEVDPMKTKAFGIGLTGIPGTIKQKNKELPGGSIKEGGKSASVRLGQKLGSLEDLKNVIVQKTENQNIYLKDIAKVQLNSLKAKVRTHLDGRQSFIVEVKKESEANTVVVVAKVRELIYKFLKENKEVQGVILIDQGKEIKTSIDNVIGAVVNGGILAAFVILIFLQSLGPTTIVALSIPMSLMITLVLMYFTGVSFNLMSLGGLALGVGMLVDNSIVVLENISRFKAQMDDPKEAVIWGTKKVASAITASTLTTVAVFGPLVFVEGMIGQLFRDISLTVVYSLTSSLFVALVLIPCLSSIEFSKSDEKKELGLDLILAPFIDTYKGQIGRSIFLMPFFLIKNIFVSIQIAFVLTMHFMTSLIGWTLTTLFKIFIWGFELIFRPVMNTVGKGQETLKQRYGKILEKRLKNKGVTLFIVVIIFGSSIYYLGQKGAELFPSEGSDRISYGLEFPSGQLLDETENIMSRAEKEILKLKGIKNVISMTGLEGPQYSNLMITFKDMKPEEFALLEPKIFETLSKIPEVKLTKMVESMISSSKPIEIEIFSDKLEELSQYGQETIKALREMKGLKDVESSLKGSISEINVSFDQGKLDRFGMDMGSYTKDLGLLIKGQLAGFIPIEGTQIPIKVQANKNYFNNMEKIKFFSVPKGEKPVSLMQVSKIERNNILGLIKHVDRKRVVTVSSDLDGIDLRTASDLIKVRLGKMFKGKNLKWAIAGQDVERQKSEKSLLFAIGLSIFLIYILLASQFESFAQPVIILFAVPLCVVGVAGILGVLDMSVSALVFIGFVILAGISVNTSIVLVDTMNERIMSGMDRFDAIVESSKNRLKPILMTTASTIIGLLPMAISIGKGAGMRRPLAITVIGGLISSTILTLIVVPLIYDLISRKKKIAQ
ncbi:efflux RND transporter permease subunit [Bacteriovoracales bacterium]|nr:efflux RND transporter permease subunit [Bacteriovoracales bacterium]